MNQRSVSEFLWWWLALASVVAFGLFGLDKWLAKRPTRRRISESSLLVASALGGWMGGLIGLLVFRHKSSKVSFLMKFFAAFVFFVLLVSVGLGLAGRL